MSMFTDMADVSATGRINTHSFVLAAAGYLCVNFEIRNLQNTGDIEMSVYLSSDIGTRFNGIGCALRVTLSMSVNIDITGARMRPTLTTSWMSVYSSDTGITIYYYYVLCIISMFCICIIVIIIIISSSSIIIKGEEDTPRRRKRATTSSRRAPSRPAATTRRRSIYLREYTTYVI